MPYKIKVKPSDFVVVENVSLPISERGKYSVYRLTKTDFNTDDARRFVSRRFGIPKELISYGGRKDRHSISEQVITIEGKDIINRFESNGIKVEFLGYSDQKMSPRFILSNTFKITIRNIEPESKDRLECAISEVSERGFINYFDEQRFRGVNERGEFVGERVLKREYNGALKLIMTDIREDDDSETKKRKKEIFENWGDWGRCLMISQTEFERRVFLRLIEKKRDFLNILRGMDKDELSMYFSVYQSFIFNEVVSRLLLSLCPTGRIYRFKTFELYFPDEISADKLNYLKNLRVPLISQKMKYPEKGVYEIYQKILEERGIGLNMFNLRKIRKAYFGSTERDVISLPEMIDLKWGEDEVYRDKIKLILQFELRPGSYATMFIKQIFFASE